MHLQALSLDTKDTDFILTRGIINAYRGKHAEAAHDFTKVLEVDVGSSVNFFNSFLHRQQIF